MDRNWDELLQELRVAQTGSQVLTAFLVTVPFQARFTALSRPQVTGYLACLVLAAITTALLVAPASWHRMAFRTGRKGELVRLAHLAARAGLLCLSAVVGGSVALVFWVAVGADAALLVIAIAFPALVCGWFLLPLLIFRRGRAPAGGPARR